MAAPRCLQLGSTTGSKGTGPCSSGGALLRCMGVDCISLLHVVGEGEGDKANMGLNPCCFLGPCRLQAVPAGSLRPYGSHPLVGAAETFSLPLTCPIIRRGS